jgi:hypothetical protein
LWVFIYNGVKRRIKGIRDAEGVEKDKIIPDKHRKVEIGVN